MTQRENDAPIGVVLMNTGTPASPDPADIRPYLAEFLSDRRLIDVPRFVWLPILHGIILRTRPAKTSPHYARIWTPEGSPFLLDSIAQRDGLQRLLDTTLDTAADTTADGQPSRFVVELAMRYGQPSLTRALDALEAAGCRRVLCLPLFPQTAFCTTGSCQDVIAQQAAARPGLQLETIEGYGVHPLWRQALARSIEQAWPSQPESKPQTDPKADPQPDPKADAQDDPDTKLLFAFHSIPVSNVAAGDTYPDQIQRDVAAVAELLGLAPDDWAIGYQSRFDNRKWLQPTPEKVLAKWAQEGVRNVVVVAPGFATDCLETLRECAEDQRAFFLEACEAKDREAAPTFTYVPCLNAQQAHLECLAQVVLDHAKGTPACADAPR